MNLAIAIVALAGVLVFFARDLRNNRPRLDLLGAVLVTTGLFALVFGLSYAETYAWAATGTWGVLAVGLVLLGTFVWWQTRAAVPLLPLGIFLDRDRGASFSAMMIVNIGTFGVFLFLTYYLQLSLHYTPIQTGIAFFPLIVGTIAAALLGTNLLLQFVGRRVLVSAGMLVAAGSLIWMAQLQLTSSYWTAVFLALLLFGIGLGLVLPAATNAATSRVALADAGAAGAAVNTTQQVSGSIGLALLSTLAAEAAANYLAAHASAGPEVVAQAALHSYAFAYLVAATIFTAGAVLVAFLYRSGVTATLGDTSVAV